MGSIWMLRLRTLRITPVLLGNQHAKRAFTTLITCTKPLGISLCHENVVQVNIRTLNLNCQNGWNIDNIHVRGLKQMHVPSENTKSTDSKTSLSYLSVIQQLQKCFQLTLQEAATLLSRYPKLKKMKPEESSGTIDYLISKGFTLQHLRNNPWLLTVNIEELDSKLSFFESKLGNRPMQDELIFLLDFPEKQLKEAVTKLYSELASGTNRLDYLREQLETDGPELNRLMHKNFRITNMTLDDLASKICLLKSNGFTAEDIRRDINRINLNYNTIENELKKLRDLGINPIRLWMLRCPEEQLRKHLNRLKDRRDVLKDHKNVLGYLAERLKKPEEEIDRTMIARYPRLAIIHPPKVKQIVDLLFSEGYGSEQIMTYPHIFQLSVATLAKRLNDLRDVKGYSLINLGMFYKSKDRFELYVKELKGKMETN